MRKGIADALVLAFSDGVSVRVWQDTGLLEREWEIYRRLSSRFGRIVLVTYGRADDAELLPRLSSSAQVALVCNATGLKREKYLAAVPQLVADRLGDARTVIVKTNQMSGGDAAVAITRGLRRERGGGRTVALVARGGYLWSQFAAWESGAASRAAVQAGEREGRLCRAADLVVGTTRQMVGDLAWRHGLTESRLCVVPNYVLPCDPRGAGERAADIVLFAGRLAPQKRVDRLIDAMGGLSPALRDRTTLSVIGEGPLEGGLRRQAARSGVRAEFEPRMPHERLLERMRRCTLYAQTSSYEGHPKTVIEAMSVGAPVLLCDTPGLRGIVRHGVSGLCVPPEAEDIALALQGMLENGQWRASLGAAAAAQALASFGIEQVLEQETAAYGRALALAAGHARPGVDVARAIRCDPELLATTPVRMVQG
jgi:glycosyltransferase involved in cell wall biosynthesis